MAGEHGLYDGPLFVALAAGRSLGALVAMVGAAGAVLGWDVGAALIVGGAGLTVAAQIALGAAAYRRAMSSPWPRVAPAEDDDWD